jgi:hypothetical protein
LQFHLHHLQIIRCNTALILQLLCTFFTIANNRQAIRL